MSNNNLIITIDRQYGSGGHIIGKKLAEDLNIPFYDGELLKEAAKESGICEEIFESFDEKPTSSFLYSLVMDPFSLGYTNNSFDMPINYKVFLASFDTIKNLANKGSGVFVGRCADYALSETGIPYLSVFVKAPLEERMNRATQVYEVDASKCKEVLTKIDKERANYYNYYTSNRWGDAKSYDLCIDSSEYGLDGSVALIRHAYDLKFEHIKKQHQDT
jgi:cytidylate kinase